MTVQCTIAYTSVTFFKVPGHHGHVYRVRLHAEFPGYKAIHISDISIVFGSIPVLKMDYEDGISLPDTPTEDTNQATLF